jgi:hypothetical protein
MPLHGELPHWIRGTPHPTRLWALGLFATGNQVAAAAAARSMIELAPTAVIRYVVLARTQGHRRALQAIVRDLSS